MNYKTAIALFGYAAAHERFMKDDDVDESIELFSEIIGSGFCQAYSGYNFFDLTDFDNFGRSKQNKEPAVIDAKEGSLWYKACSSSFEMKDSYFDLFKGDDEKEIKAFKEGSACENSGNAYFYN